MVNSEDLVVINATVITGLLILITFQILSDPTDPLLEKGVELQEEMDELVFEHDANQIVIQKACGQRFSTLESLSTTMENMEDSELGSQCIELTLADSILAAKINSQKKRYDQYVNVQKAIESLPYSSLVAGVNIFQNFLIVPFAVSSVLEINNSLKNSKDVQATRKGLIACKVGFIFLGIVIAISGLVISYEQYLWKTFSF